MKKYIVFTLIIITVLLLTLGCSKKNNEKSNLPETTRDSLIIEYAGVDSMNVLELLLKDHEVITVSSAMGTFVKAIDGVENTGHIFWFYSINDTIGDKAADKTETYDGDTVRWHYRMIAPENAKSDSLN